MTVRSLVTTRSWTIDPSVAIGAQASRNSLATMLNPPTLQIQAYDYPNPRGYSFSNELRTWVNRAQLPVPVPPPTNYNQPNPIGYSSVIDRWTFTQNVPVTNPIPSFVTSWPNPLGPVYPSSNLSFINTGFNQLESGIIQIPAEANYDQPNPRGYVHPSDLRTFTLNTALTLKALAPVPVQSYDWPNPVIKPWTPAPVVFANALQTLAIAPPFFQTQWPNPIVGITPTDRLSFYSRSDILYGFINSPIAQYDYPNPRGYQFPVDLRTWTQVIIAAEDTPPFQLTNYDQPNPVLSKWSPNNLTFINGTSRELAALVQSPPKTTYDRPNPVGYVPGIVIKSGESYSTPLTITTFVPPVSAGMHNRYFIADVGMMMSR